MKKIKHKVGDDIYVPSACYISRGSGDRVGGLVTIDEIKVDKNLGQDHFNGVFISVKEFPDTGFNYWNLLEQQDELKKQFGNKRAFPDPDIDTPWIQNGDIVNGKPWNGGDIW